MKKRIFFISLISFIVILAVFILLVVFTKDNKFYVTTIKKSHCYINKVSETQDFEIDVYITDKGSYMLDQNYIGNCYLSDDEQNLEIKIKDIREQNEILKINDVKYYLYVFNFEIPFMTESECEFNLKEAEVEINYPSDKLKLSIGNFYYLKVEDYGEYNNYLSVSKIKPIVNNVNNNKTLVGLDIAFLNNSNESLIIKNIKVLSSNITISNDEITVLDQEISSGDDISDILGYKYDYKIKDENYNFKTIDLIQNEKKEYLIPIKYINDYVVDKAGVLIEYEYLGNSYKLYYDEILFFQTTNFKISINELEINGYEDN